MGQVGRAVNGPVMWRSQLWLLTLVVLWSPGVAGVSCACEGRSDFGTFATEQPGDRCCLNFTGSSIGVLQWSVLTRWTGVRVLDLSNCNISGLRDGGRTPASLEALYLQHNRLELLPAGFLGNAPGLKILHLENNRLEVLPEALLAGSRHIREVYLGGNRLVSVPPGLFQHNLGRLTLYNNSLRCSCALYDSLTHYFAGNTNTNSSGGEEQPDSFMCFTRNQPQGLDLQAIQRSDICRSHGLTALFVCLPLALVLSAGLCWYCCCRRRRYDFNVMSQDSHVSTVEKSGLSAVGEHHYITCRGPEALPWHEKSSLTGNQLLLRPSAELLGSSRDLYEEVEIRPAGHVHSALPRVDQVYPNASKGSRVEEDEVEEEEEKEEEAVEGAQIEADRVSVTEEMQEADRRRLYMNKSANYYNLVPAIELDDSDHGEYENVDLS